MMGAYLADIVAAELADSGESMTLTRPGGASVTVKAKRLGGTPEQVTEQRAQNTLVFKISNAEIAAAAWPGPPRKDDTLTDSSSRKYTLEADADTRYHDTVTLAHFLTVLG